MNESILQSDYRNWLVGLKSTIKQRQIKAALSVNSELIRLYWDMGRQIVEKQQNTSWGSGFIDQLSKDLKEEFPQMKGFSRSNLFAIKKFYLFHNSATGIVHQVDGQLENEINLRQNVQSNNESLELCAQIPWMHNVLIIEKINEPKEAKYYLEQTIANNWSRSVLEYQIETDLYHRQGKAITNFKLTLPSVESDLASALLKDPYNFDFLTLSTNVKEQELEEKLVQHITQFLLELGKGFAYMGRQFKFVVGGKEFKTDLLFYHTRLKCYIIIELKLSGFEPEHLGKLNFYLTAINEMVKAEDDKPTIGILLCKHKNDVVVDFALKDINKPMGVSNFTYKELSLEIKNALPTIQQFTEQLNIE
ncbi:MAG: PDDEXK nuclease domain-containing protein [Paludibacter sp.]|nr:PDDEXK nuclease domain-containing protein [Paludibacter sp.]